MPGSSSNSSFIPKRGTSKRKRKVRNGNVYILTIVSYVVLFTTLVASGAVFLYGQFIKSQLQNEIAAMNGAVGNFKEADMQRVQEFDTRLRQANQRLDNNASIVAILEAIEASTIDTVRFENFSLKRELDDGYFIQASIDTDGFDSSIFQRTIYGQNNTVKNIEISDLVIREATNNSGGALGQSVSFVAQMSVPLSAVPYKAPTNSVLQPNEVVATEIPTESVSESEDESSSDSDITNEGETNQQDI